MSVNGIEQVLEQMRNISIQATGNRETQEAPSVNFSDLMKQTINQVNETQLQANSMKEAFELGIGEQNLAEVMVAVQKSNISFQSMMQVRNKLVEAYKEVMNMPI